MEGSTALSFVLSCSTSEIGTKTKESDKSTLDRTCPVIIPFALSLDVLFSLAFALELDRLNYCFFLTAGLLLLVSSLK